MPVIIDKDVVREPLYVIVPLSNVWRWKSRWKHTTRAVKHFVDSGAVVILIEVAFNRRELVFADSGLDGAPANCETHGGDGRFRHRYIALRSSSELWLKENQINLAVAQLPYDWQQVAWLDSDVHFVRPNWVGETIQQLQHYAFVQMFSHARDLSPDYEVMHSDYPHADGTSFVKAWQEGHLEHPEALVRPWARSYESFQPHDEGGPTINDGKTATPEPPRVWPGLAWGATRQGWDAVGGLLDFAIWGGADWHMAHALVDKTDDTMMRADLHSNYKAMVNAWAEGCQRRVRRNVGVVNGSVFHAWHGRKWDRNYNQKHRLLAQIGFDPQRHLKRDSQGLWQLYDDGSEAYVRLRDEMRRIAASRDEDNEDTREESWRAWKDNH